MNHCLLSVYLNLFEIGFIVEVIFHVRMAENWATKISVLKLIKLSIFSKTKIFKDIPLNDFEKLVWTFLHY